MTRSATASILVGLILVGCSSPPELSQSAPPADFVEKELPTKEEWLKRVLASPKDPIDLVEAATIIAYSQTGIARPYSTLFRDLDPYLRNIKRRIRPETTDRERIELLNEILLPLIVDPKTKNFQWIREAFASPLGPCLSNTLLYLIAAEAICLPLRVIAPPGHTFLRYEGQQGPRNIETTSRGQDLSEAQYRDIISKTQGVNDPFPEDQELWKRLFSPISRRQFVAFLFLGRSLKESDPKNQYEDCLAAWQLAPDWAATDRALARHCAIRREFDRAIELLSMAIERAPYWPVLYQDRCFNLFERGKPEKALGDIESALRLVPHCAQYHHDRADLLWRLGRAHEASIEEGVQDATSVRTTPKPGWEEVRLENFNFRVFFPGTPKESKQVLKTDQGSLLESVSFEKKDAYWLSVLVVDRSTGLLKDSSLRTMLDATRDSAIESSKATILSETLVTVSDYPGRRVLCEVPGGFMTEMLLIQANGYSYGILASQRKETKYQGECREFLDSFKLLREPPGYSPKH